MPINLHFLFPQKLPWILVREMQRRGFKKLYVQISKPKEMKGIKYYTQKPVFWTELGGEH